jgi:hypothetical protein
MSSSMLWQNSVVRIIGVKSVIPIGPCAHRDPMVLFAEGGSEGEKWSREGGLIFIK